jgi:acetoin utilization deacetylase AcuC-like enzyme
MKVIHSPASRLHAPTFYFRRGKIIPHLEQVGRYEILKAAAEKAHHDVQGAKSFGDKPVLRVHSPRYIQFLSQAWNRREEIEPGLDFVAPSHFARPQMMHYPSGMIGRVGFHMADTSTPIHEKTFEAVSASADVVVTAAEEAIAAGYAYALCRPPGHHASAESAGGFCFINNTAVAAAHVQATLGCRVGIIDIDVHHGNGSQSIFYSRDDVVTVSIHADPSAFMPYYAGYRDERGEGAGAGFNLNFPLEHRSSDDVYLRSIDDALEFCAIQRVEALVVALGLDASEHDPNGALSVTTSGFKAAGGRLGSTNWPTVIVQEGGYLSEVLGENLVAFLSGFEASRNERSGLLPQPAH